MDDHETELFEKIEYIRQKRQKRTVALKDCDDFLNGLVRFTSKHTIEDTRRFMDFLGHPDREMKIIHVAGTNGKGSVCSYISNILMAAGYHVGMFTSPHLVKVTERFQIDGQPIDDDAFINLFYQILDAVRNFNGLRGLEKADQIDSEESTTNPFFPSYFEFLFFMAMILYRDHPVDYLVLEVGLGGRLDATNTVEKPIVSVITEIGMDHMQYLGNTIAEIAGEKAGIIRSGVPVVFFDKRPEATEVIRRRAIEAGAPMVMVTPDDILDVSIETESVNHKFIDFSFKSEYDKYVHFSLDTVATYQTENAGVAVSAVEILIKQNANITEEDIRSGLKMTHWPCRMDEISPGFYVDGAHNVDGIKAFLTTVRQIDLSSQERTDAGYSDRQMPQNHLLLGIVSDKQYEEMVHMILESALFDTISVAVLNTARSLTIDKLKETFDEFLDTENDGFDHQGQSDSESKNLNPCQFENEANRLKPSVKVKYYTSVEDAMKELPVPSSSDTVFAVGSLYLAGQIKSLIDNNEK